MTPVVPELKLFTNHDADRTIIQIESLTLIYRGNYYHFPGGAGDTIHVFTQSIAIYVLTINKGYGRMALNAYMVQQPDALNGIYLHSPQEIVDHLGAEWEQLPAIDITMKLIDYLI
ncbi:hypothetical protein L4X63_23070 [Geomonas sp. Red32]|uniref:hypothetical protein n=1 Tax=Geomonas sp. Red32 TaxID=2912856 RepID=UPI00202CBE63|nr:hypothetical protein [Geomonas sp. Red32]MCM0084464.1 hypothetical protein [Geomonas sp. Red32]